jgi:hypothetical protein
VRRLDLAAEAEALGAAFSVDTLPGWQAALDRFSVATAGYAEFQVSLPSGRVSLVTLGSGDSHLACIAAHLRHVDATTEAQRVFADVRALVPGATWGVKIGLAGSAAAQVYIKSPLPLDRVLTALERQGVAATSRQLVTGAASLLDRAHVHFLGLDLTPGVPPTFELYFTQYVVTDGPDDETGDRVAGLLAAMDIPAAQQTLFAEFHPRMRHGGQTLWVSIGMTADRPLSSAKVDYAGLGMSDAIRLAEALKMPRTAMDGLVYLQSSLGVRSASYVGWRLQQQPSMSLYFTRRSRTPVPRGGPG